MIRVRRDTVFTVILLAECIFFIGMYVVGSHGMLVMRRIRHENYEREKRLNQLQQEVFALQQQVAMIEKEDFFKEKIAREQLQMARAGDMIYYLT